MSSQSKAKGKGKGKAVEFMNTAEYKAEQQERNRMYLNYCHMKGYIKRNIINEPVDTPTNDDRSNSHRKALKPIRYTDGTFSGKTWIGAAEGKRNAEQVEHVRQSSRSLTSGMIGMEDHVERDLVGRKPLFEAEKPLDSDASKGKERRPRR